ncbi:putative E3 ubiquitin-protein ligase HTD4 [Mortierella claussenii]|nr:putative E3 ubiquitin-protein ligase HTD4 [Mortierella claussenii]
MLLATAGQAHVHRAGVAAVVSLASRSASRSLLKRTHLHAPRPLNPIQSRPFLSWLFNPKEDPIVPKKLTPLKLDDAGQRLIFWDSTDTTPNLKPEFNGRDVSSLSAGIAHSCAVVDGNVHVWGSNYYSQVGLTTESFDDDDSEDVIGVHFVNQLAQEEIVQVASGNFHNLALSKTGKLWSWGSGCLGRGDEVYDSLPQPVEFFHALGRDVKQIFAAGNYSLALATPKNGNDDELYIWGYIPFGEESGEREVVPVMKKSLRPLLITSVLGYNISHVACSPWHFTIAATPASGSSSPSETSGTSGLMDTSTEASSTTSESDRISSDKPLLMTFGRFSEELPLEKPYSPLFLDLAPEDEFYDIKPWRTFRSVPSTSELAIKKMAASKGCDIVLMENGNIGISDHEDHVARLIHRPLDVSIVDVAGGSSEVIAISTEGQVLSWREPSLINEEDTSDSTKTATAGPVDDSLQARFSLKNTSPSVLHPLLGLTKDKKKAETEVLAFFDSQRRGQEQKEKTVRLVEALFESSRLVVEKPGLTKCVAQYDRFTIC